MHSAKGIPIRQPRLPMRRPRCLVVALEGLDAVGKTTAACGLRRELRRVGISVLVRHAESHYLRAAFRLSRECDDPRLKYLLQACAAKLLHNDIVAAPTHSVFICDRYFTSARAYFLALCGEPDLVNPAIPLLPMPDIAVLLECAPAIRRMRLIKLKQKPSARKLRTTRAAFSARMHELMLPAYPWVSIDTEHVSREQLIARVRDLVLEVF